MPVLNFPIDPLCTYLSDIDSILGSVVLSLLSVIRLMTNTPYVFFFFFFFCL